MKKNQNKETFTTPAQMSKRHLKGWAMLSFWQYDRDFDSILP
jgi:hypothetical protein